MPDLCGENEVCTDTSGSYTCGCLEGYEREGLLCTSEIVSLVPRPFNFALWFVNIADATSLWPRVIDV